MWSFPLQKCLRERSTMIHNCALPLLFSSLLTQQLICL